MIEKFRNWYIRNYLEITWFLIGMLVTGSIDSLARSNYVGAAIGFGIAYLNYLLYRK